MLGIIASIEIGEARIAAFYAGAREGDIESLHVQRPGPLPRRSPVAPAVSGPSLGLRVEEREGWGREAGGRGGGREEEEEREEGREKREERGERRGKREEGRERREERGTPLPRRLTVAPGRCCMF